MGQHFTYGDPFIALLISLIIFCVTLSLAAKQKIGFSLTLLLLMFTLVTGVLINNRVVLNDYLHTVDSSPSQVIMLHEEINKDLKPQIVSLQDKWTKATGQIEELNKKIEQLFSQLATTQTETHKNSELATHLQTTIEEEKHIVDRLISQIENTKKAVESNEQKTQLEIKQLEEHFVPQSIEKKKNEEPIVPPST